MSEKQESLKAAAGFYCLEDIKSVELAQGIKMQLFSGENVMMSFVTLEPGALVPLHSHPHEQMGTVLEGEFIFYIGGLAEENGKRVTKGDIYLAPGGVLHAARSIGDKPCLTLDIFGPIREDYIAMFKTTHGHEVSGLQVSEQEQK
ncbi:MAG: cupin domain-containing protein [Chloroflexi bacterium]|uniref:Cupin domain-containing protein n=1 Tax=Candidatus Chlorohelix allophototropha TaxID=3003348 RepID=A0A8T7M930_9CHLR|nr:cupin domain-containing protein [Chloroflexota bacterium]WJW68494.1 cupin domain-containing protein [Chloroflexota bacterium L227-S17]